MGVESYVINILYRLLFYDSIKISNVKDDTISRATKLRCIRELCRIGLAELLRGVEDVIELEELS